MSEPKPVHYRVLGLKVENIKRIKCVHVLPTTNVVTIGGKNDNGKTSLLDSIDYACRGAGGSICEQPVRRGATEGNIDIDLGEILISKRFKTNGSPTLKVSMKDGTAVKSPQGILDALCSKITFDPLSWMNMEPAKQKDLLAKLVGVDLEPLKLRRQGVYDDRTVVNRDLTNKRARLKSLPMFEDAPAGEIKVSALMESLTALRTRNFVKQESRNTVAQHDVVVRHQTVELNALGKEIAALQEILIAKQKKHVEMCADLSKANAQLEAAKQNAATLVDEPEQPILDQIKGADEGNQKVRDNIARKALVVEIRLLEESESEHTELIESLDSKKEALLKEAKFPLKGLSFDDSGVLLDGLPFAQAGMAKKIRASVAIGLALNPKLRVVLIRDASLLDDDSMKLLSDLADELDAQIWCEIVGDKNASVVIQDGTIKED